MLKLNKLIIPKYLEECLTVLLYFNSLILLITIDLVHKNSCTQGEKPSLHALTIQDPSGRVQSHLSVALVPQACDLVERNQKSSLIAAWLQFSRAFRQGEEPRFLDTSVALVP